MTVDIVGTGLTSILYDWTNTNEKWSVGSAISSYKDNVDKYFCLHQGQTVDHKDVITLDNYPLNTIIEKFKTNYFNNSIAYMIAYALYKGYKQINLWGVDIEKRSEYEFERPCVLYWIGIARGYGVQVNTSSGLGEVPFKYGYDTDRMGKLIKALEDRELAYRRNAEIEKDNDRKNQWVGAMYATQKIIDFIRG